MVRLLGAVVLVFALVTGCGAEPGRATEPEPGSVEVWLERIRETTSVRFDISARTEGRRSRWWTKQGEMSPMSHGFYPTDAPKPTSRMTHRYQSYVDDSTIEYQAIEQDSAIYLSDPRAKMPPGKRWVKLDLSAAIALYNRHRDITMAMDGVHPGSVFSDFDRKTLVISVGVREGDMTRYDLTAGAGVETNPNTTRNGRVSGTVWIGPDGLPAKIEQRSTGSDGNLHIRTSTYTDWNSTPMVELPAPAETAGPKEVTLPER